MTVDDKTYDGSTAATGRAALSGVIAGDAVALTGGTFAFADADAGTDKPVTVTGLALSGGDAGNYSFTTPADVLADILRRSITIAASDVSKLSGTADPVFAYVGTQGDLVSGDSLTGSLSRAEGEAEGRYAIGQGTLNAGDNYALTFTPGTLTIAPNMAEEQLPQPLRAIALPTQLGTVPSLRQPLVIESPLFCAADEACGEAR